MVCDWWKTEGNVGYGIMGGGFVSEARFYRHACTRFSELEIH